MHDLLLAAPNAVGLVTKGLVLVKGYGVAWVLALLVASGRFWVGLTWAPENSTFILMCQSFAYFKIFNF
jgi:hypothetical protein